MTAYCVVQQSSHSILPLEQSRAPLDSKAHSAAQKTSESSVRAPVKHICGAGLAPAGLDAARERGHVGIQPLRVAQQSRNIEQGAECCMRLRRRLHPLQQGAAGRLVPCLVGKKGTSITGESWSGLLNTELW